MTHAPLFEELVRLRDAGILTASARVCSGGGSPRTEADILATACLFKPLAEKWIEVDDARAKLIATAVLHEDLAYGHPLMSHAKAAELAGRFLSTTRAPRTCFTNATWHEVTQERALSLQSWNSITDATFDTGIICVDANSAVILWVQDED